MSDDTDTRLVDRDYHRKRADVARMMAAAAPDTCARRAHEAMADEHLRRAASASPAGLQLVRE